jgi:ectoine hydroxylase-related dioxygenase (phytanoyl-CoA dioxygenase family)
VVLWLGGVLHAGGANRSDRIRKGAVMSYRLGWLAPAEKLLLSTPPEVARTLPERLQRLIGYQLHKPNLGWIEGQDPIRWLRGEVRELAPVEDNLTPAHEALLAAVEADPEPFAGYLN